MKMGEFLVTFYRILGLQLVFNWSTFQHLKRDNNRAAHELARDAKLTGQSHTWKGVSPPFMQ